MNSAKLIQLALHNTTELATAFQQFEAEIEQANFDDFCRIDENAAFLECVFDGKTFSSFNNVVSACEEAGGNKYLYSDTLNCEVLESGVTVKKIQFRSVDIPECTPDSCNANQVSEEIESLVDEVAQHYEDGLSNRFQKAQCSVSLGPRASLGLGVHQS